MSGLLEGRKSAKAQKKASRAQVESMDRAIAEQRRQYDQTRSDNMPFMESGYNALARLNRADSGDMSDFYTDPSYNFTRSEGMRGIERTAAARGGAFSGNALRALSEFNSNLAGQQYGNWYSRQLARTGQGQQTQNLLANVGTNTADNVSSLQVGQGNARASGIIGADNALWNRIDTREAQARAWMGMFMGGGGQGQNLGRSGGMGG